MKLKSVIISITLFVFALSGTSNTIDYDSLINTKAENSPQRQELIAQARQGNFWSQVALWEVLQKEIKKGENNDSSVADELLAELTSRVFLVRFKPVNGFNPTTPQDFLKEIQKYGPVKSDKQRLGLGGFFRTKNAGTILVGSFLTEQPEQLRALIDKNPSLEVISEEKVTTKSFPKYLSSQQESLLPPPLNPKHPLYFKNLLAQANNGNFWSKLKLWRMLKHGETINGKKDFADANKLLQEMTDGVSMVKFKPVNGFNPTTPQGFLSEIQKHGKVTSDNQRIGLGAFFRTKDNGNILIGSFLTDKPAQLKELIDNNPSLEVVLVKKVTPKSFTEYLSSRQEYLHTNR